MHTPQRYRAGDMTGGTEVGRRPSRLPVFDPATQFASMLIELQHSSLSLRSAKVLILRYGRCHPLFWPNLMLYPTLAFLELKR
jgi:hypothetical protein